MTQYLKYKFKDSKKLVQTFDELPLWSAPFGMMLLRHLELKKNLRVLDIGSGAGFPLTELASRLGNTCKIYGVDPWKNANIRTKEKIKNYGLKNVELIENSAEELPFESNSIDLVVSNLGINNFSEPLKVFKECHRVLKPGASLVITTNIFGHWKEFYRIFDETLIQLKKTDLLPVLRKEEEHRGTTPSLIDQFTNSGYTVTKIFEESFKMNFVDGSAFFNHHFVKLGWLGSWMALFPKKDVKKIFAALEKNLNQLAEEKGGLTLSVPMLYIEGQKIV